MAASLPDEHHAVAVIDLDARVATHEACRPQYAFHGLALRHRTRIHQLLGCLVRVQGSEFGENSSARSRVGMYTCAAPKRSVSRASI